MNRISIGIIQRASLFRNVRQIHGGKVLASEVSKDVKTEKQKHISELGLTDLKVNKLEKRILVYSGKYKSVDEVPDLVNQSVMERARNKVRIKLNLWMGAVTVVGCIVVLYYGKKDVEAGETIAKKSEQFKRDAIAKLEKSQEGK